MGSGRIELPTSRLSGARSNHLSYEPQELARLSTEADLPGSPGRPLTDLSYEPLG